MDKKSKNVLIGSTLITLNGCNGVPLHLFKNIFHPIVVLVNNFTKRGETDFSDLEHFKTDTIKVDVDTLNNPEEFLKKLHNHGLITSGKVITGSKIKYDYGMNFNGKMGMGWHIKCEYAHKYLPESIKVLMNKEVFTTKEEDRFFVTVDFYGKRNPKISPKYYEEKAS